MKRLLISLLSLTAMIGINAKAHVSPADSTLVIAVNTNEGLGYFTDADGNLLFDKKFDEVMPFYSELALVIQDGKCGYINISGELVVPFVYDFGSPYFIDGYTQVGIDGKTGCINSQGELVVPCEYDGVGYFSEGLIDVEQDGKFGYVNTSGELITPVVYDSVSDFHNGFGGVECQGKWGLINAEGKLITSLIYDAVDCFYNGLAMVERDGKYGWINESGEEVVPCIYDDILTYVDEHLRMHVAFQDGVATVKLDDKWGFIDMKGEVVVPFIYNDAEIIYKQDYSVNLNYWGSYSGYVCVDRDGERGFLNTRGEEIFPCIYETIWYLSDDFAIISQGEKYGIINREGEMVYPCVCEEISPYCNFAAMAKQDGRNVLIGVRDGSIVSVFVDSFEDYSQFLGFVVVGQNGENGTKYGLYDSQCNEVVPCEYDWVTIEGETYVMGPIPVEKNGKFGFANHDGNLIIPCIYDGFNFFRGEYAFVKIGEKWGMINRSGQLILPCIYDVDEDNFDYYYIRHGVSIVQQGDVFKVVNTKGQEIVPDCNPEYTNWTWVKK